MGEEPSHMTERILNLTLEIIHLLTGEECIIVKKPFDDHMTRVSQGLSRIQSTMTEPPTPSLTPEKSKQILEVTQKIIELLTGEVSGVRDVFPTDGSSSRNPPERCPRPLYSWDSTQEHQEIPQEDQNDGPIVVKVEEEEMSMMGDDPCKEEEIPPEISTDPGGTQRDVKTEEVREVKIKEEDISPEIGMDGRYRRNSTENCPGVSPDDDTTSDSSEEKPNAPDPHPPLHHASFYPEPSTQGGSIPDPSNSIIHRLPRSRPKKFLCPECGKCFSQRTKLLVHERIHTGEKPFSCTECGKSFAEKGSLVQHQKFHAGEKPYSCSVCGKSFTLKGDVIKHGRIHTGEKPYSCSVCGKCFTLKGDLVKHVRSHTGEKPYSCPVCGKAFTLKSVLVAHQRTHTDEKPYSCSVCGKCFAQKTNLSTHERTHTGERPYSCSECGRAFTRRGNLISHQQSHQ